MASYEAAEVRSGIIAGAPHALDWKRVPKETGKLCFEHTHIVYMGAFSSSVVGCLKYFHNGQHQVQRPACSHHDAGQSPPLPFIVQKYMHCKGESAVLVRECDEIALSLYVMDLGAMTEVSALTVAGDECWTEKYPLQPQNLKLSDILHDLREKLAHANKLSVNGKVVIRMCGKKLRGNSIVVPGEIKRARARRS